METDNFSYFLTEPSLDLIDFSGAVSTQDKIKNYVLKNYPSAKKAGAQYGINPLVILAQGSIESGWGTSVIAREHNNFFGITAYGKTNDYWKGEKYISKSSGLPFRHYANSALSFLDYARLISVKYLEAAKNSYDVKKYAHAIAYSPYLSDKQGDNRPVYNTLIIKQAATIQKVLQENNIAIAGNSNAKLLSTGLFGLMVVGLLGWLGVEVFMNVKDDVVKLKTKKLPNNES